MDLKDRLDLATSGGPSHAPLEERLQHGRRAVRRRAAGRALGTLVVVSTVAVGAATLSAGQDRATEPAAPVVASPSPTPTLDIAVTASEEGWEPDEWVRMNPRSGELTVRRGVTATNILDPAVRGHVSVALDLTHDGERRLVLLVRRAGVVTVRWDAPDGRTLREFAADIQDPQDSLPVATTRGTLGADLPLVGYKDGELYTVGGATIVRVVEDPIEDWCAPNATAAVELLHEGVTYIAVLGDGNCGGYFKKYPDSPSLEASVAWLRGNIDWEMIEQGERDRKELEREVAEREQSDRK
jgi:hypothetical protein